jgi:acyl dehydratase
VDHAITPGPGHEKFRGRTFMTDFHVAIGQEVTVAKTVGESDVYLFAGITGDLSPNHVNKEYMAKSSYGKLMAHGALLVGYMSTASTKAIEHSRDDPNETPVSVGYDRVRFIKPVFIRHQDHQPGRRSGGGRPAHFAVGEERLKLMS